MKNVKYTSILGANNISDSHSVSLDRSLPYEKSGKYQIYRVEVRRGRLGTVKSGNVLPPACADRCGA